MYSILLIVNIMSETESCVSNALSEMLSFQIIYDNYCHGNRIVTRLIIRYYRSLIIIILFYTLYMHTYYILLYKYKYKFSLII